MNRPESIISVILQKFDELYPFSKIKETRYGCDMINEVVYENFVYQLTVHGTSTRMSTSDNIIIDISGRFNIFDDAVKNIEYVDVIKNSLKVDVYDITQKKKNPKVKIILGNIIIQLSEQPVKFFRYKDYYI